MTKTTVARRAPGKGKALPRRKAPAGKRSGAATRARRPRAATFAPAAERIGPIIERLDARFPEARCALDHRDPLQLLVATILSAQCTDVRVNIVTRDLFAKYHRAEDYAAADPAEFETEIQSTGFFRNKTKSILGMAHALIERHGGKVPETMDELTKLPGVGRKTANVVLGTGFGKNEGVVVDTHVGRIARRLRLTRHADPVKAEQDLMRVVPRAEWTQFAHTVIHHGRAICAARQPKCERCPITDLCPSSEV